MESQKKKRKKCKVYMSWKHEVEDCPSAVECSEGDACRKWCMVDFCSKLQKFSRRMRKSSVDGTQKEEDIMFQQEGGQKIAGEACDRLRDAYVAEFEDESSDDDDGWVGLETDIHHVGIPKMEEKEVQKEVGQESLKLPLDTSTLPLECAHRVELENPLLKLMSVLSLVNEIYYSEEKQIIHIEDVVHGNQRPFEEADNVENQQYHQDKRQQGKEEQHEVREQSRAETLVTSILPRKCVHEAREDYSFLIDRSVMLIGNSHTFEEDRCQQMEDVHANADIMAEFCQFKRTSKKMSKEDVETAKQQLQQQGLEDDSSITEEIEGAILDAKTNSDANFNGSRGKLDEDNKYVGVDRILMYKGNEEEYPKCQILVQIQIPIQIGIQIQTKMQMQIQILTVLEIPQWMLRKAKDIAANDEVIFENADGAAFYHGDCQAICQVGSQADDVNVEVMDVQQNADLILNSDTVTGFVADFEPSSDDDSTIDLDFLGETDEYAELNAVKSKQQKKSGMLQTEWKWLLNSRPAKGFEERKSDCGIADGIRVADPDFVAKKAKETDAEGGVAEQTT
ncbi:hypothetical protein L7F22_034939 [Adiantum nelumboides]|nr:hypothetical protein [Adiantum nelumboides]